MLLKKIAIAITVLTSPMMAFATEQSSIPTNKPIWEFGIQALYLNPSYSQALTQSNNAQTPPVNSFGFNNTGPMRLVSNSVANQDKDWRLGFKLEGVYHLTNKYDLNLNAYHYHQSATKNLERAVNLSGFILDELTNAAFFSEVSHNLKVQWNTLNLEMGRQLDLNSQANLRLHGGLQYANIQTNSNNSASSPSTAENAEAAAVHEYINIYDSKTAIKYNGLGPRIGADLFYDLNKAWMIYGKTATALLIGSNHFNQKINGAYTTTAYNIYGLTGPLHIASSGSSITIVPEIEAKIGVNYKHPLAKSTIMFDAGWMWADYINVQKTSAPAHGLEGRGIALQTQLNFQIQGAYLGMRWLGDMS